MKIIIRDNYDRESHSDTLIAENVPQLYAEPIADFLNEKYGGERCPDFYVAVEDNYKLYKFKP